MQGADMAQHAHIYNEIMLPYAGIIRIRFMGMISASVSRGTPAVYFRSTQRAVNQLVRQVSCLPRHAGHKHNNLTFSRLRELVYFSISFTS